MQLVVISGLSGSGKSIALNVLEDSAYYCVDNLPAKLLNGLIQFLAQEGYEHVAVSIDVRSGATLSELPGYLSQLKKSGIDVHLVFLDSKTDTLVKRFSETRRRHPLADRDRTLPECIEHERELLGDLGDLGQRIDTSDLHPSVLRSWIKDLLHTGEAGLRLLFQSFGFKHGIPLDADLVFDVRSLPNPNYDPRLRLLNGRDPAVIEFLGAEPRVRKMLDDIGRFVADWLPEFQRDNRSYLTVAIGCTGGQHRSVYFVESLAARFRGKAQVLVRHREIRP